MVFEYAELPTKEAEELVGKFSQLPFPSMKTNDYFTHFTFTNENV